jgi:hypothetical protein
MASFIEVTGPNRSGEFLGTLPTGETSLLIYWEDLEALKREWGTDRVQGDLDDLRRRRRRFDDPSGPSGLPQGLTFDNGLAEPF